jgi:hypothetical protein
MPAVSAYDGCSCRLSRLKRGFREFENPMFDFSVFDQNRIDPKKAATCIVTGAFALFTERRGAFGHPASDARKCDSGFWRTDSAPIYRPSDMSTGGTDEAPLRNVLTEALRALSAPLGL